MLWACLLFSELPLHAVFDADELAAPCVVVDGPRQRPHVVIANPIAQRSGIRAGHVLAAARALCASLQARPRDRAGEQRLLLSLAAWAYRFSSQVSLSGSDALLVEVGASLQLFGGWPALERRLRREIAIIGHAPTLAVAPLPAAARVLAGRHDGFFSDQREPMLGALGNVPIAHCGLAEAAVSLLYNVGARTLRDAFALPRPELARRIGPPALALLDRLRGIDQEILPLYQPPDRFEHRIEFDDRVEAWPPLLFPLRRLCGELALFLSARDGGVQRCALVLEHEDKPATRVAIELLTPQREARTLYDLMRCRLERTALPAAVCGMALVAADLPEFRPRHQDLFEPQREQGLEWPELAERLRAHLGDQAVRRLAAAADHRPERAWCFASGIRDDHGPAISRPGKNGARRAGAAPGPSAETMRPAQTVQESMPPVYKAAMPARESASALHESAAAAQTPPHSGNATLTPALSRQQEREKSETSSPPVQLTSETPRSSPFPLQSTPFTLQSTPLPLQSTPKTPCSSPLPLAGEAAPQAPERVAREAAKPDPLLHSNIADVVAIAETQPHIGAATLTSAVSRQRECEQSETQLSSSALARQRDREKSQASCHGSEGIAPAPEGSEQAAIPGAASVRHPASPSAAARDAMTRDVPVACPSGQPCCSQRQSCRCSHGIAPAPRLRPLWLLQRALPLRGPPPRILAGPERIESGWWDGGDTRRDYYVVQTREGQRAWAFLMPGTNDGWMLHGWFA